MFDSTDLSKRRLDEEEENLEPLTQAFSGIYQISTKRKSMKADGSTTNYAY